MDINEEENSVNVYIEQPEVSELMDEDSAGEDTESRLQLSNLMGNQFRAPAAVVHSHTVIQIISTPGNQ